jgi:hypothetical protein
MFSHTPVIEESGIAGIQLKPGMLRNAYDDDDDDDDDKKSLRGPLGL